MNGLHLNLLRVFIAVFDTRSVSRAATHLNMSQPGLSSALSRLRVILKDPLFVKSKNGVEPTLHAHDLYEPIREIVHALDTKILAEKLFEPSTTKREFRIAMSDIGAAMYLPRAMAAISAEAPHALLRSISMDPVQLEIALESGAVDAAVGYFPDLHSKSILSRMLGQHSFVCILRSGHPFRNKTITVEQYSQMQHIFVEARERYKEVVEQYLIENNITRNIVLRLPHFVSLPMIVSQTDLIATVPRELANFFPGEQGLRKLELPFKSPTFDFHLYWQRRAQKDPANTWLRSTLINAYKKVSDT